MKYRFHIGFFCATAGAVVACVFPGCIATVGADESGARPPSPDIGSCEGADGGDPARERHGTSCICCHARTFGVAGSVEHDAGVESILVVDRDGKTADMATNPHDNFFQHRRLTPPLAAVVIFADGERRTMKSPAPHGSCNACHGVTTTRVGAR